MKMTIKQASAIERAFFNTDGESRSMAELMAASPLSGFGQDVPPWTGGEISGDELVELEPDLDQMLEVARLLQPEGRRFCANEIWGAVLKPRLLQLVGWSCLRRNPALRSSAAYSTAYRRIYDALPACYGCSCL
mgnify:CR=1 FL=1